MKLKAIVGAVAGAMVALVAGSAHAATYPDFVVDPSAYATGIGQFTADKMTGNYDEIITFGPGNTFNVSLKWQAGQFVKDDGTNPLSAGVTGLGNGIPGSGQGYGLFALFQGSGTFSTDGSGITTFSLTPGGSLNLWIDPKQNTVLNKPGTGASPWTITNGSDDVQIVQNGVGVSGTGTLNPNLSTCGNGGINCGSFGQTTTFPLTAAGKSFFVNPNPFYGLSFQSGQLNQFSPTGTQEINGSVDVSFQNVPEPASIALVGIALVGLGVGVAKRRKA